MKINKLFLIGAVTLGLGLTACSDETAGGLDGEDGNTYVGVTLSFPSTPSTRALPDDYNRVGEWAGKDKIERVAIYIVDATAATVTTGQFAVGDFTIAPNPGTGETSPVLIPTKAIKTTPGDKTIYALINGTPEVEAALAKANPTTFKEAYTNAALALENTGTTTSVSTSADKLVTERDGATSETIVMTNASEVTLTVVEGVTEAEALAASSPKNRAKVNVERAVARVMVTTTTDTYDVKSSTNAVLGTISNITWVLAQGENSLYIQKKTSPIAYETPSYAWISDNTNYISHAEEKYDYSGLFEGYQAAPSFGGTSVPLLATYDADLNFITPELNKLLSGKFILPTTHAVADGESSGYKKGNTAYVLVRAKYTPGVYADGGTANTDGTFYLGANGKYYTTSDNAVTPAKNGITGQTVAKYVGGKVLYYAWVNPDHVDTQKWYNSPVVRNNVYHIHIKGFKTIGTNWNPLYPEDPEVENPKNPDPKPNVPGVEEPENPIDPEDPLTTPETWMSVDLTVLPWNVHSYEVDLGF